MDLDQGWRNAVIGSECDYWLEPILSTNAELAYQWLSYYDCENTQVSMNSSEKVITAAVSALNLEQRKSLLSCIKVHFQNGYLVKELVGYDTALYRSLIGNKTLSIFHLIPLSGLPSFIWLPLAKVALEYYSPDVIVHASLYMLYSEEEYRGEGERLKKYIDAFDNLTSNEDDLIKEIGNRGKVITQQQLDLILKQDQDLAVYGW